MKKILAGILIGVSFWSPLSLAADWSPDSRDWANLPVLKRTPFGLYLTPREAFEMKEKLGAKVLFLDVRTRAEVMYVGMASVADALVPYVEHQEMMVDWDDKRNIYLLEPNPEFPQEVARRLKEKGLNKASPIILMCRSGDRSAKAADILKMEGYSQVYSVAEGFEGDVAKDGPKAGQRVVNGWKNAGLPWSYKLDKAKMFFPSH
ncbi:hypothetical protein DLREEDagrD3_16890 [Denitratisoma sp. agr-D3]